MNIKLPTSAQVAAATNGDPLNSVTLPGKLNWIGYRFGPYVEFGPKSLFIDCEFGEGNAIGEKSTLVTCVFPGYSYMVRRRGVQEFNCIWTTAV